MVFTNKTLTEANLKIRNKGIMIAILGMGIIFVVGIIAGFVLTRRLDRISSAAARFATGDTDAQTNVSGRDELGYLGETFDKMVKDVSRKQEQLIAQHRRIQLLMDSTAEGIIGIDTEKNCSFVNRACLNLLNYSEHELLKKNLLQLIELPTELQSEFSDSSSSLKLETDDAMAVDSKGTRIPVEFRSHPLVIDGENVGAVCTVIDITQRKEHENELAMHREHLEELVASRSVKLAEQAQIIDQIHDAVVSTDIEGNILTWNKGAEKLFGYAENDAIGQPLAWLFPEEERQGLINNILNPMHKHGDLETEVRLCKKGGQVFYALLSMTKKLDRNNNAIGMIAYAVDISGRKQAEDEAHRKSIQLQMANKELESFSYSVSHDLRAPLRAIRGFTQCLSEDYQGTLDENGISLLNRIVNGTTKMGQLIEDMLALARVTSYKMKWGKVDISQLANEVIKELKESEPDRLIKITVDDNMLVHGDKHLLRILLVNLLSNAWKYSSKTELADIHIGTEIVDNSKVFYVKDNGAGFDMKYADKLFGTFQRLHSSDEFEGTGVGLATAARVVHRHHGQIWAESETGKGAIFYFKLSQLDSGSVLTKLS